MTTMLALQHCHVALLVVIVVYVLCSTAVGDDMDLSWACRTRLIARSLQTGESTQFSACEGGSFVFSPE